MATGFAVWLGSAYALYGSVTIKTTGATLPCVYGTIASAASPLPYSVFITLLKPEYFDWADFRKERLAFAIDHTSPTHAADVELEEELEAQHVTSQPHLKRWGRIAAIWAVATFLGHWVLWPLPMYASKYIFGQKVYSSLTNCIEKMLITIAVLRRLAYHLYHLAMGYHVPCRFLSYHRWTRADNRCLSRNVEGQG
jgi:hypothetical protein